MGKKSREEDIEKSWNPSQLLLYVRKKEISAASFSAVVVRTFILGGKKLWRIQHYFFQFKQLEVKPSQAELRWMDGLLTADGEKCIAFYKHDEFGRIFLLFTHKVGGWLDINRN